MGFVLLILGIVLFVGAHWYKRLAPEKRAAMGEEKGKGILAVAMLIGLVIVVFYATAGGMVAGVYTDLFQGALMVGAAIARCCHRTTPWRGRCRCWRRPSVQ